jgi:YD repeat-containing protein
VAEYGPTSQYLVSSISLPDSTSYSFVYEGTYNYTGAVTGRLASVTLPTGGTITYGYPTAASNGITCGDGTTPTLTRTVIPGGSQPQGAWSYNRTENSYTSWSTTVNDPASNQTVLSFLVYPGSFSPPLETERQVFQGSSSGGTLLETVNTCYNSPCVTTGVYFPITNRTVQTTLAGLTSAAEVSTAYNNLGLPTVVDEYDYGPTLKRETITCYATLTNIKNRPSYVQVWNTSANPSNCTGTGFAAQAAYTYDSNGNLKTEAHNTTSSTATISRTFNYGSYGVLSSFTDFNGNTTTLGSPMCSSAFPSTISLPGGTLSGSISWNCNIGLPNSITDVNSQTTNFTYDNMGRLIKTVYPDTGQVAVTYNDTASPPNIVTQTKLKSTPTYRTDTTTLDGLGRVTETELNSDPVNPVYVQTNYNASGQVASATNPYRSTTDSSYGVTSYIYDGLGRLEGNGGTSATSAITRQDNSLVGIGYSGNCATTTDEADKVRKICNDALGRVNSVTEDPSGLNYQTSYTYDVLNDLTRVTQGSQTRTYGYDMMARLTSAQTPEANSNTRFLYYTASGGGLCSGDPSALCRLTDERSVTTTYSYDSFNRLVSKSYSDGTTPSANFAYDETSVSLGVSAA